MGVNGFVRCGSSKVDRHKVMKRLQRLSDDASAPEAMRQALQAEARALPTAELGAIKQALLQKAAAPVAVAAGGALGSAGKTVGSSALIKYIIGALVTTVGTGGLVYTLVFSHSDKPTTQAENRPVSAVQAKPAVAQTGTLSAASKMPLAKPSSGLEFTLADGQEGTDGLQMPHQEQPLLPVKKPKRAIEFRLEDLEDAPRQKVALAAEPESDHDGAKNDEQHLGDAQDAEETAAETAAEETAEEMPAKQELSPLAEQLALYNKGRLALREERYRSAILHFETYLERFPNGELWQETSLSLLDALVHKKRHHRVAQLSSQLLQKPGLHSRHPELLRVQAESLARLGRCEEAEAAFQRLLRRDSSQVTLAIKRSALAKCRAQP